MRAERLRSIRAEEPLRWGIEGKANKRDKDGKTKHYKRTGLPVPVNLIIDEEKYLPLKAARVRKPDVLEFWKISERPSIIHIDMI